MDLHNKNIAIACCYKASYGGNFIKMVLNLGVALKEHYKCKIYYIFPKQTHKEWHNEIEKQFILHFIENDYKFSSDELLQLFTEWDIDLVHTNFERYDIPAIKAVKSLKKEIKVVWHLHDYLDIERKGESLNFLRRIASHIRLFRHYGWYGKKAYFIGVSAEVTNIASHYRTHFLSFPKSFPNEKLQLMTFNLAESIINGIDLSRITPIHIQRQKDRPFTFLSFGGSGKAKGICEVLSASQLLWDKGVIFQTMITTNNKVQNLLQQIYKGVKPSWLYLINEDSNVSDLYQQADCYISASKKETMSMAIAEASLSGLPIIQSDIPGTYWNANSPSAFLFQSEDAISLAEVMLSVLEMDDKEMANLCSLGLERNKQLLSMERWCERIINVYKEL